MAKNQDLRAEYDRRAAALGPKQPTHQRNTNASRERDAWYTSKGQAPPRAGQRSPFDAKPDPGFSHGYATNAAVPKPKPASTDWSALKGMTEAGLSSSDIVNLAKAGPQGVRNAQMAASRAAGRERRRNSTPAAPNPQSAKPIRSLSRGRQAPATKPSPWNDLLSSLGKKK
jgi:hypothetical protein